MPRIRSHTSRPAYQDTSLVLPIRCKEEVRLVPISDIWYCACVRNVTVIVANGEGFRVPKTLDGLENRLALHGFFRAHRGYLVNLRYVRSIIAWSRNAYTLVLYSKREIPLSKHRVGSLRQVLGW